MLSSPECLDPDGVDVSGRPVSGCIPGSNVWIDFPD